MLISAISGGQRRNHEKPLRGNAAYNMVRGSPLENYAGLISYIITFYDLVNLDEAELGSVNMFWKKERIAMLKITPILCRAGKMDNYAYLLTDEATGVSAVLDPSEAAPVIAECERQNVRPAYIFNSHHHFDHVEGNLEVKEKYGAKVLVGAYDCNRIPGADAALRTATFFVWANRKRGSFVPTAMRPGIFCGIFRRTGILFTGDVLFTFPSAACLRNG